jgi:PhoPQ-activated pathogenicity-related protein
MDAIQDFALKISNINIQKFMIAGASKRGWTTWTTVYIKNYN